MTGILELLEQHIATDTGDEETVRIVRCRCGYEWFSDDGCIDPPRSWARHVAKEVEKAQVQIAFSVQSTTAPGYGGVARVNAHWINPTDITKPGPRIGFADLPSDAADRLGMGIVMAPMMADEKNTDGGQ